MFGFNSNKNNEEAKVVADDGYYGRREIIENRIAGTFGTSDPQTIDKIWREFMPEVTNAILNTNKIAENIDDNVIQNSKNQVAINDNINVKHDEVMEELRALRLQNKELQEKYNALVERMAGYIERENGKGR